jgi:RPA family protein
MSTRPQRETAYRVFAAEFDDTGLSYAESDEERAPNYVVTPTGARVNRLFVVGVLTEVESVNEEQLRARVVDPTGAFVVYAGQYQPEALSFLERTDPPAFVAVTGKARTFEPEDADRVFTSIRPESLATVDAATRDRWSVAAAERTVERTEAMGDALDRDERGDALREALEAEGVEASLAAGIPRAIAHYGTTPTYLDSVRETALDAARVVAGDREEVAPLDVAPDAGDAPEPDGTDRGGTDRGTADATDRDAADRGEPATEASDDAAIGAESTPGAESSAEPRAGSRTDADTTTAADDETAPAAGTDEPATPAATAEADRASEPDRATDANRTPGEDGIDAGGTPADPSTGDGEPTAEADEAGASAEDADSGESEGATADVDLDDPEAFELDDDERERIEDEFGTDFESAAEVDGPGEADIETPDPSETDAGTEAADGSDAAAGETPDATDADGPESPGTDTADADATEAGESAETGPEADDTEPAEGDADGDTDPEAAVVTAMQDLDDGDGADREAVVERVVDEHGLAPEEADDGIQEALMSGECYEPDDDTLKPI